MESKRNFSLNLIFLLTLNLLVKPVYLFGIEVGVQNSVGAAEYGLFYAMFNFTFLFNVILDLGINNYQKIKVAQNEDVGMQNMATILPMKLALSGLYILVTIFAAWIMGFEGRYWFFIGWLMVNHVLSVFLLMLRANLSGLHLFFRDSVLSVTDRLLLIVGVGYLLWFGSDSFSIETFVLCQTASYSMAILIALLMTPSMSKWMRFRVDRTAIFAMVRQTWPFGLLILLMTVYNKIDGIMLERIAENGVVEAGIYAQAYRILDAGNSFAFLYAGLLLPLFSRLVATSEVSDEVRGLVDLAARFLIAPAGVAFILVFFYGDLLMQALYDHHAFESARSLLWLMGSFVFIACGYVFGTLITAAMNMKWMNIIALSTVLMNIVLNVLLIPTMGAEGAALTSFVSLGFMAMGQLIYCAGTYRIPLKNWTSRSLLLWAITAITLLSTRWFGWDDVIVLATTAGVSALCFGLFVVNLREGLSVLSLRIRKNRA